MGTGQMMFSIAAILLLSLVALMANDNFLTTGDTLDQNRQAIMAVSLATSMIDRITGRDYVFDDSLLSRKPPVHWGTPSDDVPQLTQPPLVPSADETSPQFFSDVGDFNGYTRIDSTEIGVFTTICEVSYADPDHPDVVMNTPSEVKRITVTVVPLRTGGTLPPDSVRLTTLVSYTHL